MQLSLFPIEEPPRADAQESPPPQPQAAPLRLPPRPKAESPFLRAIWLQIRRRWFPARPDIDKYSLHWSTRKQKLTLASCNLETKRILVARELNHRPFWPWLEPLLYHEMCHAYLNSEYHDKAFYALERRHPLIRPFDYWIDSGGWGSAVRSDRARRAKRVRKAEGMLFE